MNVDRDVEALYKAMKGMGTDEKALIRALAKKDPIQINVIRTEYKKRFMKDLVAHIQSETSKYFEEGLVQIVRGPLVTDCYVLYRAIQGAGTNETMLNDVLVGRSNADMNAIKAEYQRRFGKLLEADIRGDLSAATEQLFVMLISARRNEDSAPVDPMLIDKDVTDLHRAIGGNIISKDAVETCQILTSRNDAQIRAITAGYKHKFQKDLATVIKARFSGHMEDALLLLLARANNRPASDAEQLEAAMAGMGTKDELLVQRVVRVHWDRNYVAQVRTEYQKKYRRDLVSKIKSETSGDYERLLVACIEP
jgi:annexin A7/11